jgi:hypothetical protein
MGLKILIKNIQLIFFLIKTLIKYFIKGPRRYLNLFFFIIIQKPITILEIGIYRGDRSLEMIKIAKIFNKKVNYYGFDLFQDFYNDTNILKRELSKNPHYYESIKKKLNKYAKIFLFKGYTNKTLPKFIKNYSGLKIDFVFIDGGHSIKTIANDWYYVKKMMHKNTVVIFDDYYFNNNKFIKKFGCNKTVNQLTNNYFKNILFIKDTIKNLNNIKVQMVMVKRII